MKSKAVTLSASNAATTLARFAAVEAAAERIHQEQVGAKFVRAAMNGRGLHAVLTDGKTTLEVMDGKVALSVTQDAEDA